MHRLFRIKAYEAEHGPHFDEEMARKAVSKMENEDGSRGQRWSIEERDQWMSLLPVTENQKNSQFQSIDPLLVTVLLGLLFPQIKTKQSRSSKINTIFTKLKKTLSLNVTKR